MKPATTFNKSAAVNKCKLLLRSINCEIVIDTTETEMYSLLFQSETKKKMLLSWLIQQIYSPNSCNSTSFEDLVSLFIPRKYLRDFLTGSMPLQEQYERWKLIITSVRAKRNCDICNETSDESTGRPVHSTIANSEKFILDHENYFEKAWNARNKTNYSALLSGQHKTMNVKDLEFELMTAKKNMEDDSCLKVDDVTPSSIANRSVQSIISTFKYDDERLSKMLNQRYLPSSMHTNKQDDTLKYTTLNESIVGEASRKLKTVNQSINVLEKLAKDFNNLS